ncbi:MAG: hypothetical protein KJN81_02350 [Acidimicrobiia bacterium]|nr:hypothetical protein [Acidimicrobiia bacterium]NNL27249.1 hypothetical protein [Acidimicrobiia bacterium]
MDTMNILKRIAAGLVAGAVAFYSALYLIISLQDAGLDLPEWTPIALLGASGFAGTLVVAAMAEVQATRVVVYALLGLVTGLVAGWLSTQISAMDGLEWWMAASVVIISIAALSTASD